MAIPITPLIAPNYNYRPVITGQWRYLGYLPDERQWGPAVGLVAGELTVAGGKNYGDITIDKIQNDHYWQRDIKRELRYKREFVAGLTVPHTWFLRFCGF